MNNLILVINPETAEKLKSQGFNYITQQINKTTYYAFANDPSLTSLLNKNFSKKDYVATNKLTF